MKTSIIISAVLIGVSVLAYAAKENIVTDAKAFDPGRFYGLIINDNANIILSQGEKNSVRIEGEKNSVKNIRTEIQDGALVVSGGKGARVNVYITVEDINMIEVNGDSKVFGVGTINSDILLLKANSLASMKIDVRTLKVAMIAKGNSKIIVSGSTGESYSRQMGKGKVVMDALYAFTSVEDNTTQKSSVKGAEKIEQPQSIQ